MKYLLCMVALITSVVQAQNKPFKKTAGTKEAKPVSAGTEKAMPVPQPVQEKQFVINGTITGLTDDAPVSLTDVNNPTDTLSTAILQNNAFVLKGTVAEPNLYYLNFDATRKALLFIGNERITVNGDISNLQDITVTGSAVHSDFRDFQNTFNPLFKKLSDMNQQIQMNPALQQNDSMMNRYRANYELIKFSIDKFVTAKKSSPVSAFLLFVTRALDQDVEALDNRFQQLDAEVQNGFYGKVVGDMLAKAKVGAIGTDAMEFTQNDVNGKPISLSDFRGKYVLIDFWASWCKPCRMENPNVVTAYNKFKNKNFTILGVSLDREKDPWVEAIQADQLTWTQVSDLKYWSNAVARLYNVEGIPQNFLIDPEGKIVGKNLRGPYLEAKLCELLGCN